ncbi:hypothetical protein KDU71_14540 [Carboxylicivirga sediminis]|uniref:Uncharacterized protein n=1 Tax=Carboxylicivirga sediminis TaxID=2006564 RepID=A0A941IYR9_9BACT|nr:hypothetical protein [Carboxylicivirga sediminis]MBR8536789.1 hypothetical protein [Carboxylicivirga sediminis]
MESIADLSLIPDNLRDELKMALEKTIEYVDNNCVGKFIIDKLLNNNVTFKFVYKPDFEYSAGYKSTSNEFILKTIESWYGTQMFIHELTHALQDALYPTEVIESASSGLQIGYIQLELEAHIIEDLSKSGKGIEQYKRLSLDRNIQRNYELQILTKLKAGESIDMEYFNALLGPFGEYFNPEYNTPPDLNFVPAIFKIAYSNCNN